MADYWTSATITPYIPADLLDEPTRRKLAACNMTIHPSEGNLAYLQSDDLYVTTEIEDPDSPEEVLDVDIHEVLQDIVKRSQTRLPFLVLEAADTCSRPRSDGFGGWASVITADHIETWSTMRWINDTLQRLAEQQGQEWLARWEDPSFQTDEPTGS